NHYHRIREAFQSHSLDCPPCKFCKWLYRKMSTNSILTIDDDRSVHHMVKKSLESSGIEVHSAYTATEGFSLIDSHSPDAVLLDVMLPDMSGLEAFEVIQEKDARLPVIVVTGSGSSDTAIQAMKLGAFDYVNKPI